MITWDDAKRAAKHGLDFADVIQFDFDTALHDFDDREEYGEVREIAIGWCGTGCASWFSSGAALTKFA